MVYEEPLHFSFYCSVCGVSFRIKFLETICRDKKGSFKEKLNNRRGTGRSVGEVEMSRIRSGGTSGMVLSERDKKKEYML